MPFTIVVSNNEVAHGAAYTFDNMPPINEGRRIVVRTVSRHLKTGDYTLEGFEDRICVERKQLSDLFQCCGNERDRFRAEVQRMSEMEHAFIVIEADTREAWRPSEFFANWKSKVRPRSVEGTLVSWSLRYRNVHWWPCGSRRAAEIRTFEVLEMFWRNLSKAAKPIP
jgi:ERCC4-type nuclease